MKHDVILFDLDGTLTDPGEGITNSVAYALRKLGQTPPPRAGLEAYIGPPLVDSFEKLACLDRPTAELAVKYYREYFADTGIFENEIYPGIHEMLEQLKQAGAVLLRTDYLGGIVAVSDGREISFTWENPSARPEEALQAGTACFIGNTKSGTLHTEDCDSLPKEENRTYFDSYAAALAAGYRPCGSCLG